MDAHWRSDFFPPLREDDSIKKGSVTLTPPRPGDIQRASVQRPAQCKTIFVGNLPTEIREDHLYDTFSSCGRIEDIRLNYVKRFCHIQFLRESGAEKSIAYSGYRLRIGPENSIAHVSKINVDYAHVHVKQLEKERLPFSPQNMSMISQQLKDKMTFDRACLQIKEWLESGYNTPDTASSFFALMSTIHERAQQVVEGASRYNRSVCTMMEEARVSTLESCELIGEILEVAATNPKSWDSFNRPQQNSVNQWLEWLKSYNVELKNKRNVFSSSEVQNDEEEQPSKRAKPNDEDVHYREEIRKLKSELEASKTKYLQELSAKQQQINQLTLISTQFRKKFPEEWKMTTEEQITQSQCEVDSSSNPSYKNAESDKVHHSGLSQHEIAILSVLGTFLAVHPLGATLGEIAEYAAVFNPNLQYEYIESLMKKVPEVFRVSKPKDCDEAKWWFLGFQSMSLPYQPTIQP